MAKQKKQSQRIQAKPPAKKTVEAFVAGADVGPASEPARGRELRFTLRLDERQHAKLRRIVECTHHSMQSLVLELVWAGIGDDVEAYIDKVVAERRAQTR